MKKTIIISIISYICLTIISSFLIIKFYFNNNKQYTKEKTDISFILNEPDYSINFDDTYEEKGANLKINNKTIDKLEIKSNIDTKKYGNYYVSYKYKMNNYRTLKLYRKISITDKIPPEIKLNDGDVVQVELNSEFVDPGFEVTDNIDENLKDLVKVTGSVDTKKVGTYEIKYEVSDSSSNKTEVTRKVIVYKKVTIIKNANTVAEKGSEDNKFNYTNYTNTVTKLNFNNTGFYIEGYYKDYVGDYKLKISGNGIDKEYNLDKKNEKYTGNIDITSLENGIYNIYILTDTENLLKSELTETEKIVRAHIGKKLITMIYTNNNVGFKVEDFAYQYDIIIDPGHGGSDVGAVNSITKESLINLEQSLYEKNRYEEHGLKVYMIRDTDSAGLVMGPKDWPLVRRRAYAMGYYGVVSKIMYSNHHNSFNNNIRSGYEILLPAHFNKEALKLEYNIAFEWSKIYPLTEDHTRLYARDYESEIIYNKPNGEIYNFRDYYAVIRIPYELYNVKNVIYEGCYMSNSADFSWYYLDKNYINLSEIKIKYYVESLGITYIPKGDV